MFVFRRRRVCVCVCVKHIIIYRAVPLILYGWHSHQRGRHLMYLNKVLPQIITVSYIKQVNTQHNTMAWNGLKLGHGHSIRFVWMRREI